MSGVGREYVYDAPTGATISRLDWDVQSVTMFQATTAFRPVDALEFALSGATNFSTSAHMDDYDFNVPGCPPTASGGTFCESNHPGTRLEGALQLDASARVRGLRFGAFEVSPLVGYAYDWMSWRAYNGRSNYAGVFNNGLGISYQQWWEAPYVGLAIVGAHGPFGVSLSGAYSEWGHGRDRDHHHNRSLVFTERFDDVEMLKLEAGLTYALTSTIKLAFDYSYHSWGLAKGPTSLMDLGQGQVTTFPGNAAGASLSTQTLSFGVVMSLDQDKTSSSGDHSGGTSWTGPYIGASVDWSGHTVDWTTTEVADGRYDVFADTARASFDTTSPGGSFFAGYAWQLGRVVLGVEASGGASRGSSYTTGMPGTSDAADMQAAADSVVVEQGFDGSLRARGGYLVTPTLMAYGTAGVAVLEQTISLSCRSFSVYCIHAHSDVEEQVLVGWTVGGGLEYLLSPHIALRGEYRYQDFGTEGLTALTSTANNFFSSMKDTLSAEVGTDSHRVSVGVAYKF